MYLAQKTLQCALLITEKTFRYKGENKVDKRWAILLRGTTEGRVLNDCVLIENTWLWILGTKHPWSLFLSLFPLVVEGSLIW